VQLCKARQPNVQTAAESLLIMDSALVRNHLFTEHTFNKYHQTQRKTTLIPMLAITEILSDFQAINVQEN